MEEENTEFNKEGEGGGRYFGKYNCENCKNEWRSACSWKDTYQQCRSCGKQVLPYAQSPLRKSEDYNNYPSKKHPQELCQKCGEMGRYCGRY